MSLTVHDMLSKNYDAYPAAVGAQNNGRTLVRRILGSQLKGAINGSTPANGDSYAILNLSKRQVVTQVLLIVVKADDTALTLGIGHSDAIGDASTGTNESISTFQTNTALNSTGVTSTTTAMKYFDADGYKVIITPNTLTAMDDALEFIVVVRVIDLNFTPIAAALTAPI
jgi:hypothetical protein